MQTNETLKSILSLFSDCLMILRISYKFCRITRYVQFVHQLCHPPSHVRGFAYILLFLFHVIPTWNSEFSDLSLNVFLFVFVFIFQGYLLKHPDQMDMLCIIMFKNTESRGRMPGWKLWLGHWPTL